MTIAGRVWRKLTQAQPTFAPAGHYYSPIPAYAELARDAGRIWGPPPVEIPGIELDQHKQLLFLDEVSRLAHEAPAWLEAPTSWRYYYNNPFYGPGDALSWHGVLRHLDPQRVVEVGSGFSTAVFLDTREHTHLAARLTCIEPDPVRLNALLRGVDREQTTIIEKRVQDVDPTVLTGLEAGDVLFIDSSHVAKCGSDVVYLYLEILPRLARGVWVHIHDVFYPFEYPREWLTREGRAFNEDYFLRALLVENPRWRIRLWNHYLATMEPERFAHALPQATSNSGASIWLERM
jgi:hypothetical protein